jgi:hypothetical protein
MLRAAACLFAAIGVPWAFASLRTNEVVAAAPEADEAADEEARPATLVAQPCQEPAEAASEADAADVSTADASPKPLPTIPLRVTVVDGDSGAFLRTASWRVETKPDEPPIGAASGEAAEVVSRDEYGRPVDPSWNLVAVAPLGDEASWVRWEAPPTAAALSRYARSLVAVAPLHPEAEVRVALSTSDGTPLLLDSVSASLDVGGRTVELRDRQREARGLRLRGVPFVRGAGWSLGVFALSEPRAAWTGSVRGVLRGRPSDGIRVALRLEPLGDFGEPESDTECSGMSFG